jgi:hypothetical protein
MKNILFSIGSLVIFHLADAQSISNQVIASSGFSSLSGGASIDFTSGELVVKTEMSAGIILTQGFHQPYLGSASVNELEPDLDILLYPNPTSNMLSIKCKTANIKELKTEVYDLFSRKISVPSTLQDGVWVLNLETLAAATYQVLVIDAATGRILKTFKIQKTSNQ